MTNHFEEYEKEYVTWRAFTWHMAKVAALLEHRPAFVELKVFIYLQQHKNTIFGPSRPVFYAKNKLILDDIFKLFGFLKD